MYDLNRTHTHVWVSYVYALEIIFLYSDRMKLELLTLQVMIKQTGTSALLWRMLTSLLGISLMQCILVCLFVLIFVLDFFPSLVCVIFPNIILAKQYYMNPYVKLLCYLFSSLDILYCMYNCLLACSL